MRDYVFMEESCTWWTWWINTLFWYHPRFPRLTQVTRRLVAAAKQLKQGGPFEEGVEIGPSCNKMQFDKVRGRGYIGAWGDAFKKEIGYISLAILRTFVIHTRTPLNLTQSYHIICNVQVQKYIAVTKAEVGAELLLGGGRPEGQAFEKGFWTAPTIFKVSGGLLLSGVFIVIGRLTIENDRECQVRFGTPFQYIIIV